ncbi:hypothetical protein GOA77_13565 [Sinorhizobium meliloti]|nr:hypothetical protein [Sinorhizobium meliloti]MDW9902883.1 hypothetical protein [Sinorhizobium meliloti]RVI87690.1 hypothetical protein CN188_02005 [Sinorhizobium meliloti]RVP27623.1 hypothetical protein CN082_17880 [Sinorhizobium meliloti]
MLVPGSRRDFPFVGIAVSWQFVAAFAVGCALICAFAWKRFSEPSYDVNAAAFRDFKDLAIWNLKDSFSLRRAYAIYCVSLIFIYGILAFFGRVIVQLFDELSVSGLQIGMGTIEFDSWKWPLFLALGISGFAPLINPLVPAENWLRRFSHEVVGIPTRLKEKAVRLKTLIDGAPSDEISRKTSTWVKTVLGPKLNNCFALDRNLKSIVLWSYKEHVEWSDPEIRKKLNEYERNVRDETEAALADFQYLTDPRKTPDSLVVKDQDRIKDLEKRLLGNVRLLDELRDKFSLIMAIYCEFGSRFDKMEPGSLKDSIIEKIVDKREIPATGLPLHWFITVFVLYFLVIKAQWHSLISSVPLSDEAAATSAALETLKVFLLVWLPTTGVAAFVSVVYGPTVSESPVNKGIAWATISGALGAFAVAAIGMTLIAVLYSALPASNVSQMWQSLFGSGDWTGTLLYFLLLAPVAIISFCFVSSVRAPVKAPPLWFIGGLAVAAASFTVIYLGIVVGFTVPEKCMIGKPAEPVSVWDILSLRGENLETCFAYYGALDLIVLPLSVAFSVLGLAPRRLRERKRRSKARRIQVCMLAIACAIGSPVVTDGSPTQAREIVVGFRTDIPPFSYSAPPDQGTEKRPYLGYLAELCYEIFDNSDYQLIQVPVDGNNRFAAMQRPLDSPPELKGKKIDVLCDAVTVRLDDPERMKAGVFSPTVFVSGISYLWRSVRTFADVEIGYLDNSTAWRVAKEACTVDALRLGSSGKAPSCFTEGKSDCLYERSRGKPEPEPTKSLKRRSSTVPSYVLCPKGDHDKLVEWFCSDTYRDKVYFGDREIILGKLASWRATGRPCEGVRDPFQSFTYEPYALLISRSSMEFFPFVQRRVYELFSHRAGAEALFYKWFPGQTMSEPLAWLFSLNGVMEQDRLLSGEKQFPNIKPHDSPNVIPQQQ